MERLSNIYEGEELKLSKYAFFIEKDSENIIIYSSLSGLILHCYDKQYINKTREIMNSEKVKYDPQNDLVRILYENRILIKFDINEDILVRSMYENGIMSANDIKIMLIVTRNCNFDCSYCGQKHENKVMQSDIYDSVYKFFEKKLTEKKVSGVEVSFFGGEPLLAYSSIIKLLKQLKPLCKKFNVPFKASMTTNGYLLTFSKFKSLVNYGCVHYQITVDGIEESHDRVRYLKNKKGTWKNIMKNLQDAISLKDDFSIVLRTNYNFEIFNSIDNLYKYVEKNLSDKRITIYYESIKDHGNEKCPETVDQIESLSYNEEIVQSLKRHKLQSVNVLKRTAPCSWLCYASKPNFFIVDYDGTVKKCSHQLDESFNKIGFLNSDGTMDLDNYLNSKWIYNDYLVNSSCKECLILPLCMGKRCPRKYFLNDFQCVNTIDEINLKLEISSYV